MLRRASPTSTFLGFIEIISDRDKIGLNQKQAQKNAISADKCQRNQR
jgi:hypothetical protein